MGGERESWKNVRNTWHGATVRRALLAGLSTVVLASGPVLAHPDHEGPHGSTAGPETWAPPVLFLVSGLSLSVALYLHRAGEIDRQMAAGGVVVGIVGILTSLVLPFL